MITLLLKLIKNKRVIIPLCVLIFILGGYGASMVKKNLDAPKEEKVADEETKTEEKGFDLVGSILSLFGKEKASLETDKAEDSKQSDFEKKVLDKLIPEGEAAPEADSEEKPSEEGVSSTSAPAISLHDVYAEKGKEVRFYVADPSDSTYKWEVFDVALNDWVTKEDSQTQNDEFGRKLHYVSILASEENHKTMVRCTHGDKEEVAFLYVITKKIAGIEPASSKADLNTCLVSFQYPVKVSFSDGSAEEIAGLWDLFFGNQKSERAEEFDEFGMMQETLTIKTSESYYHKAVGDKEELAIRYHPSDGEIIKKEFTLEGTDETAPEIENVQLGDFKISQSDTGETPVSITVTARDNVTPLPQLQYALVRTDAKEIKEEAWSDSPSFNVPISQNGRYVVCVRDKAGNVSKLEREIITTDSKPPEIKAVSLSSTEGWVQKNTISVVAEDKTAISYCFNNVETGESSGFIDKNEFDATSNGKWNVQVRDRAGNIAESEITVSNIDNHAPKINIIKVR